MVTTCLLSLDFQRILTDLLTWVSCFEYKELRAPFQPSLAHVLEEPCILSSEICQRWLSCSSYFLESIWQWQSYTKVIPQWKKKRKRNACHINTSLLASGQLSSSTCFPLPSTPSPFAHCIFLPLPKRLWVHAGAAERCQVCVSHKHSAVQSCADGCVSILYLEISFSCPQGTLLPTSSGFQPRVDCSLWIAITQLILLSFSMKSNFVSLLEEGRNDGKGGMVPISLKI